MTSKKHHTKHASLTELYTLDFEETYSEKYGITYQPRDKDLFKTHKVPKFKRRFAREW